jgi:tetratricopeptide (TPR) repeat protein
VYRATGNPQRALALYEQALPIRKEVGDRAGEAATLNNMAGVYRATGNPQRAFELYEEALPIMKEVGDRAGEAATLNNMAGVYQDIGNPQRALELYEEALPITKEVGDRAGEATTLNNMAGLLYSQDKREEAIKSKKQAVYILKQVGLEYDASGTPLSQVQSELVQMEQGTFGASANQTISDEQLRIIVSNTITVTYAMPEKKTEWRQIISNVLAKAHEFKRKEDAEFFQALLDLLDGRSPSLPEEHPYHTALDQILAGKLEDDTGQDEETTQPEGHELEDSQELPPDFVYHCRESLQGSSIQKSELFNYLQLLCIQQPQWNRLVHAIQIAIFDDPPAQPGKDLDQDERHIFDQIVM